MLVLCFVVSGSAISRNFTHYVYLCVSMCMPTCTRYVCGSAGTFTLSLSRQRALPRTVCMRQRGHFHSFTLKAARHFQSFTHYMHAAARALSLFHSRGSAAAPGHVCMSAATVCRTAAREFVRVRVRVGRSLSGGPCLRSCGPAALRPCGCVLCCHAVSDACARPGTTYVCRCASRCVNRCHARGGSGGLAMEAWRWRLGAGGLALEASWPVAVRRRPLVVALGAAWRGVARRGMWRGE